MDVGTHVVDTRVWEGRNSLVDQDVKTYVNKKVCRHMNLSVHLRSTVICLCRRFRLDIV
jgi:hypothetical protein